MSGPITFAQAGDGNPSFDIASGIDVTVSTVSSLPLLGGGYDISAFGNSGSIYTFYTLEVTYMQDQHILQLPVASSTTTAAAFCVMANPTMKKIVRWSAERWGEPPVAPTIATDDVLLKHTILTEGAELGADSLTYIFSASGKYEYGLVTPTTEFNFPTPPYVQLESCQTALALFQSDLVC